VVHEGDVQTSDASRRENTEARLFEIVNEEAEQGAATYFASYVGSTRLRGRSRFGEAQARVSNDLHKSLSKKMDCRVKARQ
jgi:hypothetical protein